MKDSMVSAKYHKRQQLLSISLVPLEPGAIEDWLTYRRAIIA